MDDVQMDKCIRGKKCIRLKDNANAQECFFSLPIHSCSSQQQHQQQQERQRHIVNFNN